MGSLGGGEKKKMMKEKEKGFAVVGVVVVSFGVGADAGVLMSLLLWCLCLSPRRRK